MLCVLISVIQTSAVSAVCLVRPARLLCLITRVLLFICKYIDDDDDNSSNSNNNNHNNNNNNTIIIIIIIV